MTLKQNLILLLNKLPYIRGLYHENINFKKKLLYPSGHFYSEIVSVEEVMRRQNTIWGKENIDGIRGIDLNVDDQIKLVKQFELYYGEIPFPKIKSHDKRYYFENEFYSYTDAIFLYSIIRHFKPNRIIEIGSGFSSSVMLDTNEHFFNKSINLTFIEPNANRLKSLLNENDYDTIAIIEKFVQDVKIETFEKLNYGDILFIDSTHVVKTGSDVNYILFEILPKLKSGVIIHFHDIFYPFEYPKEWVFMGRNWNEDYFLRAFLMYNKEFEIMLFSHYLNKHHKHIFTEMPLCLKNTGGNLWLRKK
ncbi:MAG: class I SAM-dependent methyltransferase [Leadbetterella sp.]|jgi:predicted O-methyltransferase YrrM|nr:class I SAM-dependent methyltransferase [Leadbetterella sp.]